MFIATLRDDMNLKITGLRVDNEIGMELSEIDILHTAAENVRQEILGAAELGYPKIEIPGSKQKRQPVPNIPSAPDIPFLRGLTVF